MFEPLVKKAFSSKSKFILFFLRNTLTNIREKCFFNQNFKLFFYRNFLAILLPDISCNLTWIFYSVERECLSIKISSFSWIKLWFYFPYSADKKSTPLKKSNYGGFFFLCVCVCVCVCVFCFCYYYKGY